MCEQNLDLYQSMKLQVGSTKSCLLWCEESFVQATLTFMLLVIIHKVIQEFDVSILLSVTYLPSSGPPSPFSTNISELSLVFITLRWHFFCNILEIFIIQLPEFSSCKRDWDWSWLTIYLSIGKCPVAWLRLQCPQAEIHRRHNKSAYSKGGFLVILAPLTSRWGYTLVHIMEYINVMPVVTVLSSGCSSYYQVSLSLLSIKGGADQGFRRLARASGISLRK